MLVFALAAATPAGDGPPRQGTHASAGPANLVATAHAPLPTTPASYWLVPPATWKPGTATTRAAAADLARAVSLIDARKAAQALPLIRTTRLSATPLRDYAVFTRGLAELQLSRYAEARRTFAAVRATQPQGALGEQATMREAEAADGHELLAGRDVQKEETAQRVGDGDAADLLDRDFGAEDRDFGRVRHHLAAQHGHLLRGGRDGDHGAQGGNERQA